MIYDQSSFQIFLHSSNICFFVYIHLHTCNLIMLGKAICVPLSKVEENEELTLSASRRILLTVFCDIYLQWQMCVKSGIKKCAFSTGVK